MSSGFSKQREDFNMKKKGSPKETTILEPLLYQNTKTKIPLTGDTESLKMCE